MEFYARLLGQGAKRTELTIVVPDKGSAEALEVRGGCAGQFTKRIPVQCHYILLRQRP
jgi:hypothetical protein